MNPLQRALIEKTGHDHGFEYVLPDVADVVRMASARHRAQVCIAPDEGRFAVRFDAPGTHTLNAELARSFPALMSAEAGFVACGDEALAQLLRRAAALSHALPNQAVQDFEASLVLALAELPAALRDTEVERLVRQRVGQQAFRSAMLDYWGGACAVTGLGLPEVLRASHAKPWALCASDAERLDVFNGFLLSANLDALFDRFLISFADDGALLVAPTLNLRTRELLGLNLSLKLRWLAAAHRPYLQFHRDQFEAGI
jgi:hypothetical protein